MVNGMRNQEPQKLDMMKEEMSLPSSTGDKGVLAGEAALRSLATHFDALLKGFGEVGGGLAMEAGVVFVFFNRGTSVKSCPAMAQSTCQRAVSGRVNGGGVSGGSAGGGMSGAADSRSRTKT